MIKNKMRAKFDFCSHFFTITNFFVYFIQKNICMDGISVKRTKCEKKIDNKYITLKLGTVNRSKPIPIYLEGSTYISPSNELNSYEQNIMRIKNNFKCSISKRLKSNNIFDNKYLLDFGISVAGIKSNKKSYLSFQLFLKQKDINRPKDINTIKNSSSVFLDDLANDLVSAINSNDFEVYKTKKGTIY